MLFSHEALVLMVVLGTVYFVVVGAPGNRIRFETEKVGTGTAGNLGFALNHGVLGAIKFLYNLFWVRGGLILFLATLSSSVAFGVGKEGGVASKARLWSDWLFAQTMLMGLTLMMPVMYSYSSGVSYMIPRTITVLSFFWSLNLMVSAVLMAGLLPLPIQKPQRTRFGVFSLAPAACLIYLLAFGRDSNIRRLYVDFMEGQVSAYRDVQIRQLALFQACDDRGLQQIPAPKKPMTFVWDVSDGNWGSRYYQYYRDCLCGKSLQSQSP
ncbi:MAG: hypothetical protein EBU88_12345 [Acidobacteria bacterium]|nr:hypothetical protein [Acidobacteriota bacterium]